MKRLSAVILAVLMCITILTACKKTKTSDDFISKDAESTESVESTESTSVEESSAVASKEESSEEESFAEESTAAPTKLVGTVWYWPAGDMTEAYVFNADGTIDMTVPAYGMGYKGTYSIEDDKITATMAINGQEIPFLDDNTYKIEDGKAYFYYQGDLIETLTSTDYSKITFDKNDPAVKKLVGHWRYEDEDGVIEWSFKDDGTVTVIMEGHQTMNCDYLINGDRMLLYSEDEEYGYPMIVDDSFRFEDDTLYIHSDVFERELVRIEAPTISESPEPDISIPANEGDDKLLGTWTASQDDMVLGMTFSKDGVLELDMMGIKVSGIYSVSDGKMTAALTFMGETEIMFADADYYFRNGKLYIDDGIDLVELTKK